MFWQILRSTINSIIFIKYFEVCLARQRVFRGMDGLAVFWQILRSTMNSIIFIKYFEVCRNVLFVAPQAQHSTPRSTRTSSKAKYAPTRARKRKHQLARASMLSSINLYRSIVFSKRTNKSKSDRE